MATALLVARDRGGVDTDFLVLTDEVYHLEYAAAGSKNITVPTGASYGVISTSNSGVHYAVKIGTGAAIGTTDIVDGTGNALNVERFVLPSGTTQISIAASAAVKITISWYRHAS